MSIESFLDSAEAALGLANGQPASYWAAHDPQPSEGGWVDTVTRITAQSAPRLSTDVINGMNQRGWQVEQIRVPAQEGPAIVAVKVGMPVGLQGPPNLDMAASDLADTVNGLPYTGGGAVATGAGEVNDQVLQPTLKDLGKVGAGVGAVATVLILAYLLILLPRGS